jgi:predicted transcriptional regulator
MPSSNEACEPMTATLTIELKPEVGQKLSELSARTRQSAAALAAEAVASYVERESHILDAIARGLADMKAGRLVPHDEAMDELDAAIELAAESK